MNWAAILTTVKVRGYTGAGDLESVKTWADENRIDFSGPDGPIDLDKVYNKTVTIEVTADAGEEVAVIDGSAAEEVAEEAAAEEQAASKVEDEEESPAEEEEEEKALKLRAARRKALPKKDNSDLLVRKNKMDGQVYRVGGLSAASIRHEARRKAYTEMAKQGKAFVGGKWRRSVFKTADRAELLTAMLRLQIAQQAKVFSHQGVIERYTMFDYDNAVYCSHYGLKAQSTVNPIEGGALVNDEFATELLDFQAEFDELSELVPAQSQGVDFKQHPRLTDDPVVTFPGENGTITESVTNTDQVGVTLRKSAVLQKASMEILADSEISVADMLVRTAVRATNRSQLRGYLGDMDTQLDIDGYSGLASLDYTGENIYSVNVTDWNDLVQSDLQNWKGKMPQEAFDAGGVKIVCSLEFYSTILTGLAMSSAGGTTPADITGGVGTAKMFDGIPVVTTNAAPRSFTADQYVAFIGSFPGASIVSNHTEGARLDVSDQRYFDQDQIAYRYIERHGHTHHDAGDTTSLADNRSMVVPLELT